MTRTNPDRGADLGALRLAIEVFVQLPEGADRQMLRMPSGCSIREVLALAGHAAAIAAIEAGELGLARHGARARLDDRLTTATRLEVMRPITADAKAWRRERVAARRAGKSQGGWNRRT